MAMDGERRAAEITTINKISGKENRRIHIIAVVVSITEGAGTEVILDDGTDRITARSFENLEFFAGVQLGSIVRVIGTVKSLNEQTYLIPEIIKKIQNRQFVTLHKLLLNAYEQKGVSQKIQSICEIVQEGQQALKEEEIEEIPIDADDNINDSPFDELLHLIQRLDKGDGAQIEEIVAESGEKSEKIIHNLLEAGEIFEIKPGRVKIL